MLVVWALLLSAFGAAQALVDSVSEQEQSAKSVSEIPDDMKTVKHDKVAGKGYEPGSPLYDEQQKKKGVKAAKLAPVDIWGQVPLVKESLDEESLKVPKHPDEAYDTWKKNWAFFTGAHLASVLLTSFVNVLIVLCCAFVYMRNKVDPRQPPLDGLDHEAYLLDKNDWRFGLFDCFRTPPICMLSCCCPTIRWADTMRMAGILSFYTGVVVMTVLTSLGPLAGGLTMLIGVCIAVHQRQRIRRLFGMPAGNASTYCQDCCVYTCCSVCAIVQEARQVEEAYAVNHPVVRIMAPPIIIN